MLAALALPIMPWTIRNQVVLDRTVPISTGGGKALYVGTYLPADGEYQRVKAILVERYLGLDLDPGLRGARRSRPDRRSSTGRRRALPRPAARRGPRQDRQGELLRLLRRRPGGYAAMTVRKVGRMWSERRRRSDEQHRRPGRPGPPRPARTGRFRRCSACAAAGGSWSPWRPRSSSSPRSARSRWRRRGATRC